MGRGSRQQPDQGLRPRLARRLQALRARDLAHLTSPDPERLAILRDQANELEAIVIQQGWPEQSDVGEVAALSAWLVAQHSPSLIQQQFFYRHLASAVENGEAKAAHLAQLYDRILVRQGQKQLYGTQSHLNDRGQAELMPVFEPENLARRRRQVGLEVESDASRISG